MIFVTCKTSKSIRKRNYDDMYDHLKKSVNKCGHDLTHVTCDTHDDSMHLFMERLYGYHEYLAHTDENTVLLDSDTLLLSDVSEVFKGNYDIGVCYRSRQFDARHLNHSCNAGVIFAPAGHREAQLEFYDKWINTAKGFYDEFPWFFEQHALNVIVGQPKKERTTQDYHKQKPFKSSTKNVDGIKVKFFDALVYNSPLRSKIYDAKLLHYCNMISEHSLCAWIP